MRIFSLFLLIILFLFSSCSNIEKKQEKFIKAYKEILITRETLLDTLEANRKVLEILTKYGYDEITFRNDFFELAKNSEQFRVMLDSLRQSIIRDTIR